MSDKPFNSDKPFISETFNKLLGDRADEVKLPKRNGVYIPDIKPVAEVIAEDLKNLDEKDAASAGNLTPAQLQQKVVSENKTAVNFEEGRKSVARAGLRHDIMEEKRSGQF